MFLMPTPPRVTRRSKIENVFLLILRCLVVCLLAMGFARPFLSKPMAPGPLSRLGQKIVLLLDTSASMRRAGLWPQAKEKAKAVLRNLAPADQVACYAFDQNSRALMTFEQWTALPSGDRAAIGSQKLDELTPGWGSTRLGNALISAAEVFESTSKDEPGERRIVVITDLQEGSKLEGLQGFEWPKNVTVTIDPVKPLHTSNATIQLALDREDAEVSSKEPGLRVRINNASDSKREQFQVGWRVGASPTSLAAIEAYVPPGQSRVVTVPRLEGALDADRLVLTGDEDDFDNTLYVIPQKVDHAKVIFLGPANEKDSTQPLYYLKRAFQETRKLAVDILARDSQTPLTEPDLAGVRLILVNDALSPDQVRTVRSFVNSGRTVLLTMRDPAMATTLGQLLGVDGLSVEEAPGGNYAMLGHIDFQHALFSPFAEPRYSDFTKIHFWKHRRIGLEKIPGSRILAEFDDGSPALAEVQAGKGRVWLLMSSWQPQDSQLALSSKFVPLLYAMLEESGGIKQSRSQYFVGDPVPYPAEGESVTIRRPDTSETKWIQGESYRTEQPGIYTVSSMQPPITFAVNLLPEESKTAPLTLEEFERLGVPLQHETTPSKREVQHHREHLQAVELEGRQKLWRWLIVAALVILVMETWLAGQVTRRAVSVISET
jgi:hypothetical protein